VVPSVVLRHECTWDYDPGLVVVVTFCSVEVG
jgi:hypothetical protein